MSDFDSKIRKILNGTSKSEKAKLKEELRGEILGLSELECEVIKSYMLAHKAYKMANRTYIRNTVFMIVAILKFILSLFVFLSKKGLI